MVQAKADAGAQRDYNDQLKKRMAELEAKVVDGDSWRAVLEAELQTANSEVQTRTRKCDALAVELSASQVRLRSRCPIGCVAGLGI